MPILPAPPCCLSDGDLAVRSGRSVCAAFLLAAAAELGEDVRLIWRVAVVMSVDGLNWLRTFQSARL